MKGQKIPLHDDRHFVNDFREIVLESVLQNNQNNQWFTNKSSKKGFKKVIESLLN